VRVCLITIVISTFLHQKKIITNSNTNPVKVIVNINHHNKKNLKPNVNKYQNIKNSNKKTLNKQIPSYPQHNLKQKIKKITTKITKSLITLSNNNQKTQTRLLSLKKNIKKLKKSKYPQQTKSNHTSNYTNQKTSPNPKINFPLLNQQKNTSYTKNHLNIKIKPPKFNEKKILYKFINSFKICCKINQWNYNATGLYLASCLSGNAKSLLTKLNGKKKKNYNTLIKKLTKKYKCLNKVKVFKTQLRTQVRKNGKKISKLARSIKKLSHQAYPNAPPQ
jgi:hypothetical protein